MIHHIKTSHNDRNDSLKSNGRFNFVLTDLSPQRHYRKAVWVGDELFYVVWEIKDGDFYCAVFYVGPKNRSSKFTYKFSLTTENGLKNISLFFQTQSVLKNMDNVFTPGDCVHLHYDTVTKFLNSEKFLHCAFEISPIETASGGDRDLAKHGASNDVNCDPDCLTDERDLLEQEVKRELLASYDSMSDGSRPHHSDNYRNGRGARRGRGIGLGRFNRAGRRGPEARDFMYRAEHFGRISKLGRSLTDLRDETLYEGEDKETLMLGNLRDIAHANRLKLNSSSSSPAPKHEKIDKITCASGFGKSQEKVKANYHKVKPSGLPAAKDAPREHITKFSAVGKPQGNYQESVPTVISHPSLSSVKSAPNVLASTHERTEGKSQFNDSKVKTPSSEHVTDATVLGKPQGNVQESVQTVISHPSLSSVKYAPHELASTHERTEGKSQVIDSKVKSPSSEHATGATILGKPQGTFQESVQTVTSYTRLSSVKYAPNELASTYERTEGKSQVSDSKVKSPSSEHVTDATVLGKPQGNFQESVQTVTSHTRLSSVKYAPNELASTHERREGKSQINDSKVKTPSSKHVTDATVLGKAQGNVQVYVPTVTSHPRLSPVKYAPNELASTYERTEGKSQVNDSNVKSPSSEHATEATILGEPQGNIQESGPIIRSSEFPSATSISHTIAPTRSKPHDKTEIIYPKPDSVPVDDFQITDFSPFDTLHDVVQANLTKRYAPVNVSTLSDIPNQQSTSMSPDTSLQNQQPDTVTASEDTSNCLLCGYLCPVVLKNRWNRFVESGTKWKCKLCCQ
jgi:hypothetical protein